MPQIDKNKLRDERKRDNDTHQEREASGGMRESLHFLRVLCGVRNERIPIYDQPGEGEGQEESSARRLRVHDLVSLYQFLASPNDLTEASTITKVTTRDIYIQDVVNG